MDWKNQPSKCSKCRDKMKPCTLFAQTGSCRFGDQCRFGHADDAGTAAGVHVTAGRSCGAQPGAIDKECDRFAGGTCLAGDECPFRHPGREAEQKIMAAVHRQSAGFSGTLAVKKKAVSFHQP